MKPSKLLPVALGTCSWLAFWKNARSNWPSMRCRFQHSRLLRPGHFKILLKYILAGRRLTENVISKAIQLSDAKYCSVSATIQGNVKISTEFVIETRF
ncbi:MAG: hypothetical protein C4545_05600 [Anaerolineaceae bacterium]|nr:MAG: hypothetical protein C4545_05600 [Anaerolineaceae bacterium]